MNEDRIRELIRDELGRFYKKDKFIFHQHSQILDGRNFQVGLTTGTKIGTGITQKLSFYGVTPVVQAGAIASPAANAADLKVAVDAIRVALTNIGITG